MKAGLHVIALVAGLVAASTLARAQPGDPATGSGSAGSAAGSGSGGPRIIQLPTDANAPQVSAAASPTVVRLGGKFTLFVTATFDAGVEVNLREPVDLGPAFEVTRKVSEDRPAGDGRKTREWQIEVIAWELGDLSLAPIAVTYTAYGKADQTETNVVRLRVEGVLGDVVDDPKALRGNAPPTVLLARDWFWLYVAIGSVVFLAAAISIFVLVRNRRRRRVVLVGGSYVAPKKFDTASERALARLLKIEQSGVLERDDDRKQGYADMVEVIREYLGTRYRVATFDLTSSELLRRLDKQAPPDELAMIERWLERCDIVKYGGLKATTADAHATLEAARELVISTTQQTAKPVVSTEPPEPEPPPPPPSPPQPPPGGGGEDDHEADRTERMDKLHGEEAA
ncbi:MAG TPA: hypothetical protein VFQ53_30195 [Kofleriaceae bacterium]|nr:hypothetical protein [Kofleriaceae bacterium]